jgi:hypothetical protein
MDAAAIQMVNKRVSDMDDYRTVVAAGIYFPSDKATLDDAAKTDLDVVAAATQGLEGYMIEVAGYAALNNSISSSAKTAQRPWCSICATRRIFRCGESSHRRATAPLIQPLRTLTPKDAR